MCIFWCQFVDVHILCNICMKYIRIKQMCQCDTNDCGIWSVFFFPLCTFSPSYGKNFTFWDHYRLPSYTRLFFFSSIYFTFNFPVLKDLLHLFYFISIPFGFHSFYFCSFIYYFCCVSLFFVSIIIFFLSHSQNCSDV